MSSQSFRHRENEEWRASGARERSVGQESAGTEGKQEVSATPPPTAPCTPTKSPLFPEAVDLGSAASLFRIAQSQTHPNAQDTLQALRARLKNTLDHQERIPVSSKTALRDILTSTDSRWLPTLKVAAIVLLCALLAAGVYAVMQWVQPAASEPAAVAGTAIAFLLRF